MNSICGQCPTDCCQLSWELDKYFFLLVISGVVLDLERITSLNHLWGCFSSPWLSHKRLAGFESLDWYTFGLKEKLKKKKNSVLPEILTICPK